MNPYFKTQGDVIIFTGKYMEIYIPEFYFDKKAAEMIGDHFKTIGILNFRTFNSDDGTKPNPIKVLNIPAEIYTYPSGGFEDRTLDLVGKGEDKYTVLKYYNGDTLCHSKIPQSTKSFNVILNILLQGKLPGTIPYDKVFDIWNKSFSINGVSMSDIPDVTKELVVAQIYRDKTNPGRTFAQALAKNPRLSMTDYITASPRELTISQSNFTGLIFEDLEQMLIGGINNTKSNKDELTSPLEEVMKY